MITSPYRVHFRKRIYFQNQHDEHYAMALVSSESEYFEFLAFLNPFWIINLGIGLKTRVVRPVINYL